MWAITSIAFIAAILTAVGYYLLVQAERPRKVEGKQVVFLNFGCTLAAMAFEKFVDTHGPAPNLAYAVAAAEPLITALAVLVSNHRKRAG